MLRFVLHQNVARYRALLATESDPQTRQTIDALITRTQRELNDLEVSSFGAFSGPYLVNYHATRAHAAAQSAFLNELEGACLPFMLINPGPDLRIVDVNEPYAAMTLTRRLAVAGRPLFEVFPDNPEDAKADGVNNLYASLRKAAETGTTHQMALQRYDVRDDGGVFVERYWQPQNTPILDANGRLTHLLHTAEDVTESVLSVKPQAAGAQP
jgi:PAS domain-containing protein